MKKFLSLFLCFLLFPGLCACGEQRIPPTTPIPDPVEAPVLPVPQESPEPVDLGDAPKILVTLYRGDSSAAYILPVECEINARSPEAILEMLYELGVFREPVSANGFTVDDNNVIHLDMDLGFAELVQSAGAAGERIMVGSLVNSFLSVFEADAVYITIDGGTFETGSSVYEYNLGFFEN